MKKLYCILLVIFLVPVVLFSESNKKTSSSDLIFKVEDDDTEKQKNNSSGPFGLKMGMTLDQITQACNNTKPKQIEGDKYYVYPAKKHPLFKYYYAYVDSSEGLYCLQAVSDDIKTNDYGTELKQAFSEIKNRISKTYGNPRMIDVVDPNTIWKSDSFWLTALDEGARTYAAVWDKKLKDDLLYVYINTSAASFKETGWITLEYGFSNKSIVEDFQDDVF